MDDRRFDALVKTLTAGGSPRRGILQALGTSALATLLGRFSATEDADAKKHRKHKKKKKCKRGKRKCNGKCIPKDICCVDGDCAAVERCEAGQCVAKRVECLNDDDCDPGKVCRNGVCVPDPAPECVANADCASGEACFGGTCVVIAGTCDATDDHCAVDESLCNEGGAGDCFCLQRFGGGAACSQVFVPGSACGGCTSDAQCEALEAGSVCVSPVENGCPCEAGQGICARLCPNQ